MAQWYKEIAGVTTAVAVVTEADFGQPDDYRMVVACGGMISARVPAGSFGPDWVEGPVILVTEGVVGYLSEAQLVALLRHEQGHISCGHLDDPAVRLVASKVIDDVTKEIEADAYACTYSDPDDLASGLFGIIDYTSKISAERKGCNPYDLAESIMNSDSIKTRLAVMGL